MTLQTTLRIVTAIAIAAALPALGLAQTADQHTAFLQGTTREVAPHTQGTLDFTDSSNLQFHFGESDYKIPAGQITGYEWAKPSSDGFGAALSRGASKVGKTVLPMLFGGTTYLTLHYRPENSTDAQQAVFEVPKQLVAEADPVLRNWLRHNREIPAAELAARQEENWWGNRFWKTRQNRHLWEQREAAGQTREGVELATRE